MQSPLRFHCNLDLIQQTSYSNKFLTYSIRREGAQQYANHNHSDYAISSNTQAY